MVDAVADNASAARYVAGAPVHPLDLDLRLVGVVLKKNGSVVAFPSRRVMSSQPQSTG